MILLEAGAVIRAYRVRTSQNNVMNGKSDIEEGEIDYDHLRWMVNNIIYWFCGDKAKMIKTQDVLVGLFDEFAEEDVKKFELEKQQRKRTKRTAVKNASPNVV